MLNAHFCSTGEVSTCQGFGGLALIEEWRIRYGHWCPTGLTPPVNGYVP